MTNTDLILLEKVRAIFTTTGNLKKIYQIIEDLRKSSNIIDAIVSKFSIPTKTTITTTDFEAIIEVQYNNETLAKFVATNKPEEQKEKPDKGLIRKIAKAAKKAYDSLKKTFKDHKYKIFLIFVALAIGVVAVARYLKKRKETNIKESLLIESYIQEAAFNPKSLIDKLYNPLKALQSINKQTFGIVLAIGFLLVGLFALIFGLLAGPIANAIIKLACKGRSSDCIEFTKNLIRNGKYQRHASAFLRVYFTVGDTLWRTLKLSRYTHYTSFHDYISSLI